MSAAIAWQQIDQRLALTIAGKPFGWLIQSSFEPAAYSLKGNEVFVFNSSREAKDWLIEELLKSDLIQEQDS